MTPVVSGCLVHWSSCRVINGTAERRSGLLRQPFPQRPAWRRLCLSVQLHTVSVPGVPGTRTLPGVLVAGSVGSWCRGGCGINGRLRVLCPGIRSHLQSRLSVSSLALEIDCLPHPSSILPWPPQPAIVICHFCFELWAAKAEDTVNSTQTVSD